MSLISYSEFKGELYGALTYTSLTDSFKINLLEDVFADLIENNIYPSDQYLAGTGVFIPFTKLESSISALPFFSRPEAAYKLGSLQFFNSLYNTAPIGEPPVYEPICFASEYIIYPLQTYEARRFCILTPGYSEDTYEIDFETTSYTAEQVNVYDTRVQSGYSDLRRNTLGCFLNCQNEIEITIKFFYSLRLSAVVPADFPNDVQFVYI